MKKRTAPLLAAVSTILLIATLAHPAHAAPKDYFAIEVVDEQTGRGVPMVELETTSKARYYTDSAGLIAFNEPGLMNRKVWFTVTAHGYEHEKDWLGSPGVALDVKAGGTAKVKVKRVNIAERLYRVTGQGIYRDSLLLGRKPPIAEPALNAEVTGQDSVLTAVYKNKIYWFWGDTNKAGYFLGLFQTAGATSDLPGKGGLDPAKGVNLKYFTGDDGFARKLVPLADKGLFWIDGVLTVNDDKGQERLFAHASHMLSLTERIGRHLIVWNDAKQVFDKVADVPLDAPLGPGGHPFRVKRDDGTEYFYFLEPYPAVRTKADWKSLTDLSTYEAYTPLKAGTRFGDKNSAQLDRDASGKLVWAWKKNTEPLKPQQMKELIDAGKMKREESPHRLQNADGGKPVILHGGSVNWNEYRKKYVMIAQEVMGDSMLGEIWYAESARPEGPWVHARKIVTHANKPKDKQDFYNPTQHPFFDQEGGRYIFLEGTFVNTFSGNTYATPYYDYNQIMYRLDLSDPRLKMPE